MWAKARSKLGALIRPCGDGVVSNEAKMESFILHGKQKHPSCTQNRAVPTHHCTPDALRWLSRLAMAVDEGLQQTRCIDSPVRRRGGVKCSENGVSFSMEINQPLLHTDTNRSDPLLHCRCQTSTHHCTPLTFPICHGCGRRPEAN
jgi:hypothetical protein